MIIPTPRFWILLAFGIILALGGAIIPGLELLVLPYNLFLAIVFAFTAYLGKQSNPLSVQRRTNPLLSVNISNQVHLSLENIGNQPLEFHIRDEAPDTATPRENEFRIHLAPFEIADKNYSVTPRERGKQQFRGTYYRFLAPLGLARIQKHIQNQEDVRVFPNVQAVREFDLLKQKGQLNRIGVRQSRIKGLGTEFESLRDYHEDDYRKIDWKASARRGKLVVRNYEQESNQSVIVCVDLGRQMLSEVDGIRKLDYCLDSSLLLLHAAERAGDQIGLIMFNDEIKKFVSPRKGKAQVSAITEALYDSLAEPVQSDYLAAFSYLAKRWKRRSLIVLFTDSENYDQANELAIALEVIRKRHLLIVVRVSDPKIKALSTQTVHSEKQFFDKAASLWYLNDRQRAEARLASSGIQSLESEPEELGATLVGAYLRVKDLNLL